MSFKNVFKIFLITLFLFAGGKIVSAGTFGWQGGALISPAVFEYEITGSKFYLSQRAEAQSISVYIDFNQNASTTAGIYDNAENLVATTTIIENTSGDIPAAWFTFPFVENPTLEIGNYRLVVWTNGADVEIYLEENSTFGSDFEENFNWPTLPSTYTPEEAEETLNVAIYATYSGVAGSFVAIPTDFASSTLAYAGQLFTDLSLVIILIIGLPLAFWVIKKVISLV